VSEEFLFPRFQSDWKRNSKKTTLWSKPLVSVLRSVARRRLVKTENPSACATVNWKLYRSEIALYLSVIKSTCIQGANKSNNPKQNPLFSSRLPRTHDNIFWKIYILPNYKIFSSLFSSSHILLSSLFSKSPNTCSSLNERHQISQHKNRLIGIEDS
jgi:hypothetical protein